MIIFNVTNNGKLKFVVNSLNSNLTTMVRTPLESNFFNQTKVKKICFFFLSLSYVSRFIFDLVFFVQVLHLSWLNDLSCFRIPKFTAPLLHNNFGAGYMIKINFKNNKRLNWANWQLTSVSQPMWRIFQLKKNFEK